VNSETAFIAVASALISAADPEEKLPMLDALATLASAAGLNAWAAEVARIADAMRSAESLQLNFLERLSASNSPTPQ
jgi:hypothetical protein